MVAKGTSIKEVAVQVVLASKTPLHIATITERVLNRVKVASATPEKTVNNALQKDGRVERIGKGIFQVARRVRIIPR